MQEIREIGEDGLETLVEVARAANPREEATVDGFVDWKRQAASMAWFLAGDGAGGAFALTGWHTPPGEAIGVALVRPEERGRGLGGALLETIEGWARDQAQTHLEGWVSEADEPSIGWAQRRGYEETGRNSRMVLDLTSIAPPDTSPPPGIEIVTWAERPELAQGLWEVAREAAPDIPGEEDTDTGPFEDWLSRDMQGSGDRPEAVFVAVEGDEVLGYAKLAFSTEPSKRAYHDLTGVKRAHRGRGIAAALKATQIAWAKAQGYEQLQTANEVRNAPIRHLNAKHGYVLEPGNVILQKKL